MSSSSPPPPPLPPLGWRKKRKMATPTTTTTPPNHPCPPTCKNPNHKLNLPFPSPPSPLPGPSFLPSPPKPPRAPKPPTGPTQMTKLPSIPNAFFISQGHIPFTSSSSSSQPVKSTTLALSRTDTDKRRMMRLYARGLRSAPFPSKMLAAVVAAVSAQKPVEVILPFEYGAHDPQLLDRLSDYHETFDDVMVEAREKTNGAYPPAEKDCRPVHYDVPEMAKCWKREVSGGTSGRGANVVLEVGKNEKVEEAVEKAAGEVVLEVVEAMRRSRFVRFETGDDHEDMELSVINYMRRYRRLARAMKV